jgi:putative ABC transport system substrate-binding protein
MRRRAFLGAASAAMARRGAFAQATGPARIGWLTIARHPHIASFRLGMGDAGRTEGTDFVIVERYADGASERLPDLARDLDGAADIVVVSGQAAAIAAHRFVGRPVVVVSSDFLSLGIIASYARPGGNITGFDLAFERVAAKWPELLAEVVPATRRLAVFVVGPIEPPSSQFVAAAATAASLGIAAFAIDASDLAFARHFDDALARGASAVIVISNPTFGSARAGLLAAAAARRMPVVYENRDFPHEGGLMSYGPDLGSIFRRAALTVDRILRGAAPASIPVELPRQFELVINLRTARALGLNVPAALLARADEVIE